MFKTGDIVIHPGWVVCKVKEVRRSFSGNGDEAVYSLKPYSIKNSGDFRILMTAQQAKRAGIRYPVDENAISRAFEILKEKPNPGKEGDDFYARMKEKLSVGDLCGSAEVLRYMKTFDRSQGSYSSKEIVGKARKRLIEEIAYVRKEPRTRIGRLIDSALRKT